MSCFTVIQLHIDCRCFYTHTVMYTAPNLLCSIILGTNTPSVFSLNVLLFHDMKNCVKNIFFYFLN